MKFLFRARGFAAVAVWAAVLHSSAAADTLNYVISGEIYSAATQACGACGLTADGIDTFGDLAPQAGTNVVGAPFTLSFSLAASPGMTSKRAGLNFPDAGQGPMIFQNFAVSVNDTAVNLTNFTNLGSQAYAQLIFVYQQPNPALSGHYIVQDNTQHIEAFQFSLFPNAPVIPPSLDTPYTADNFGNLPSPCTVEGVSCNDMSFYDEGPVSTSATGFAYYEAIHAHITSIAVSAASSITTNTFASPCINPHDSCGAAPTLTGSGNIAAGDAQIGTGGGAGTLNVGPATLTTTTLTLGAQSEGDATIQSGGKIQTGQLTVGSGDTSGSLNIQGGGTVTASKTLVGASGVIALTGQGSTFNAGSSLVFSPSSNEVSVSIGSGSSLVVGSGSGQGLDVKAGGTIQYNLTPNGSASVSAGGPVSFETGSTLLAAASATGNKQFAPGSDFALISADPGQLSQYKAPYGPNLTLNSATQMLSRPLGSGSIVISALSDTTSVAPQGGTYSNSFMLVPTISSTSQGNDVLALQAEQIRYNPGASPLDTQHQAEIAYIGTLANASVVPVTSTVRSDFQQAQEIFDCMVRPPCSSSKAQDPIKAIYNPADFAGQTFQTDAENHVVFTNPVVQALADNTIQQMKQEIDDIIAGGGIVSNHILNVSSNFIAVDVGPNALGSLGELPLAFVRSALSLQQFGVVYAVRCNLQGAGCASNDPAIHIEFAKDVNGSYVRPSDVAAEDASNAASLSKNILSGIVDSHGIESFDIAVSEGQPINLDPNAPVVGFDFFTGQGDPTFTSVMLPDLGTPGMFYELFVQIDRQWQLETLLRPLTTYTFSEFGGVDAFRILGIDPSDGFTIDDHSGFDAQLTFLDSGMFTGSIVPISSDNIGGTVPEPATLALFGTGLVGAVAMRRRKRMAS